MKRLTIPAIVLLAACGSRRAVDKPVVETILAPISQFEDARTYDAALVSSWSESTSAVIRARVAVALGRLMKRESLPVLLKLMSDEDSSVRQEALFAAGQLGLGPEPLTAEDSDLLLQAAVIAVKGSEEASRARGMEAIGKLALEKSPGLAIPHLKDPSPLVRRQAAAACFRWRRVLRMRDPAAKPPEIAKEVVEALSEAAADPDHEVRWRAIHVLLQGGAKPSPSVVTRFLADSEPLARLFALNVVERQKIAELAEASGRAQGEGEAFVRQAAVRALDALERPELLLKKLVSDPSHHVREAVADLLAADGPELASLAKDPSPAVRVAALLARVRIFGDQSLPELEAAMSDTDPRLRIAAVKGAGHLKEKGLALVLKARKDDVENVRAAALIVLGEIEGVEAWVSIREGLQAKGLAERGSAVEASGKRKESDVVNAAIECFKNSGDRDWVEIRESIVDLLAERPVTSEFLIKVGNNDPAASVRDKAITAMKKRGVVVIPQAKSEPATRTPHFSRRFTSNPTVVLHTSKGYVEIECLAGDAPLHVANFVGLVEKGFYDGLAWHRVVPNFVIQGGDPLGNGWGDAGWSLRAEINAVPYGRGAVGMPRSAGYDTGGCQIFITHIPTPHLDGFYTVFGRVVKGLEVIDKIEIGDRIVRATVRR